MDSKDIIKRLRHAKTAHMSWVSRAGALIEGKAVDKEQIPILATDCVFGTWYYSDGKKELSHLNAYHEIEPPHNELHQIYAEIFDLLFGDEKASFIARLTRGHKARDENLKKARQRFQDLQHVSNIIMEKLESLENEIRMVESLTGKTAKLDLDLS